MRKIISILILLSFSSFADLTEREDLIKEELTQRILEMGENSTQRFSYIETLNQEVDRYMKTKKLGSNLNFIIKQTFNTLDMNQLKITHKEILLTLITMTKGS